MKLSRRFAYSLIAVFAVSVPVLPAYAQDTKTDADKTANARAAQQLKNEPPAPANPLVLVNPDNGSGNSANKFDDKGNRKPPRRMEFPDEGDYRNALDDPRLGTQNDKKLPLFGYNFFAPAREFIEARRNYLLALYDPQYAATLRRRKAAVKPTADTTKKNTLIRKSNSPYEQEPTGTKRVPRKTTDDGSADDTMQDDANADNAVPRRRVRPYYPPDDTTNTTNSDSGNNDDTANPRRRSRTMDDNGNTVDDPSGDGSDTDNSGMDDTTAPRRRVRRSTNNNAASDTTNDPSDPNYTGSNAENDRDPNDQASSLDDLRRRQRGTDDETLAAQRNRRNANDTQYNDNAATNGTNRSSTTRNRNTTNQNRDYSGYAPYSRRPNSDDTVPSVNAFSQIADPLTQMFSNVRASVPTSYAISGGDKLTVTYRTPTLAEREFSSVVDPSGYLNVEGMGRLVVRGMTLEQASAAIKSRLSRLYRGVDVTVQLAELRTIGVTVSGEAVAPGGYTVPAVATAINVLYAAGGPTENGTLRRIEIRRQGRLAGTVDIYKFLTGGDQRDIPLQSGDMIVIPARQSLVVVKGEVRNAARFEIADGETLNDALKYAGGIKPSGVNQSVQVNTLEPGRERVLKTVDLKDRTAAGSLALYDGDRVDVFSVRQVTANKVTAEGAIDQPGDYALLPGMHVADLVERARGTLPEAYLNRAELYRWNPDNTTTLIPINLENALKNDPAANVELTKWDRLKVYTREEVAFTGYRKMEVRGAVQRPGVYVRSENMHVSDLLLQAGGPAPDAYLDRAVLLHQRGDGTFAYDQVSVAAILHGDRGQDKLIEDNDLLALYKVGEANFTPEHVVSVRGEVVAPGIYPRGDGMKISDLVKLAGGMKPSAGSNVVLAHARHIVDKDNARTLTVKVAFDRRGYCAPNDDIAVEDGDVLTIQGDGAFQNDVQLITIKGAVNKPGPIILTKKGMRLSEALREAGGLRPEAFPEGAEFTRIPQMLASTGQKTLTEKISLLSDLLNDSQYKRSLAASDIERLRAAGAAAQSDTGLAGLTGGGAVQPNPAGAVLAAQLGQHDLVSKARVLRDSELVPNGNIAVNLPEAMRRPTGDEDILLVDGDTINVPEKPTTIQVAGAVVNPRGVLYKPGANLDYYITRVGGYAPDVAKERIVVIRAGGGLFPAGKIGELRPGDLIFVPTRVLAEKITDNQSGLNAIFRGVTNSAISALLVTRLLGL